MNKSDPVKRWLYFCKVKNNLWEIQYSEFEYNLWGLKPVNTLVNYIEFVSSEGKVLDLGMGEGRNALYFVSKGFETEGVDLSETAVNRCRENSKRACQRGGGIPKSLIINTETYQKRNEIS